MSPIRLGVIGLSARGWASSSLIPPIFDPLLSSKYTLTALCTSSEASAKASAAKYTELAGRPVRGYFGESGPYDIANDPEVDMVVVSVKVPDHYKAAIPAIEAGKDIFIEWTPGRDLEETARLADAARKKGVRSLVGAQSMHSITAKKIKELVDNGKVGRVLSSSASLVFPSNARLWSSTATPSTAFYLDKTHGITLLTIPIGHYLTMLSFVLSEVTAVSATAAIRIPEVAIVDENGNPTGERRTKNTYDQIIITGTLGGHNEGALFTFHAQSGPASGRFLWQVDGEEGVIEARNRPEKGLLSVFAGIHELKVVFNGEEVELETKEEDRLGSTGKAWLEFAKGPEGRYETLESSVRAWKVMDAVLKSIEADGKTIQIV
ncbi:NAD-binding Rossmann fold oxidoreductase [Trametopsis cervina]|nr:NAD-binding Rossmann fold oxidoreductase [Trametopsis cervina]